MERFLTLFIFGAVIRFLITIINKLPFKLGKRVYCDGCGTELPKNDLKLELKPKKGSVPEYTYSPYSQTSGHSNKFYQRYLESIDNGTLHIMKFCTKCGGPTPVIYVSGFSIAASWAILPLVILASIILLMGNCVFISLDNEDMLIPMGFWNIFVGGAATALGVVIAMGVTRPETYRKAFILGLIPVLIVNGTCTSMYLSG